MHNCFQLAEESPRTGHTTRILSRQQEIAPQRLNLNLAIVEMTPMLEHVLGPDIATEIQCEQDIPPILGVGNMVKLALMDLCASARQAMPQGGHLEISTRVQQVEESRAGRFLEQRLSEFVCLTIRYEENGPARRAKHLAASQDDANASLERVYGIAQQHCGWLEVTRGPGQTTSLDLFLPVANAGNARSFQDNAAVEIAGGNETILLVEDEIDLLSLTREILERYGYRIIAAPSGVAALKLWAERKSEINLLLTDMRMPEGITGRELAERLTAEKPDLKVIYVSGYSIEGPYAGDLREGDNYLTKPYTPPGLAQIIRRRLDFHAPAQAA
jgi:two-component system, cell cycle sensor histidine kinase and response regulator CckA